jgi:hypothetical protein
VTFEWVVTHASVTIVLSFESPISSSCSAFFSTITIVNMHAQSNLNERDGLPKIQRTAAAMLDLLSAGSHISKPTPVFDSSSITLDFTFPHDIFTPLLKLPDRTREELLGRLTNRLNELQEQFLSCFRSACSVARNANDLDAIRQGLRNIYLRRCISPLQLQLSRLSDVSKHQPKNSSGKKTFNNVSAYGCSYVYVPPTAI